MRSGGVSGGTHGRFLDAIVLPSAPLDGGAFISRTSDLHFQRPFVARDSRLPHYLLARHFVKGLRLGL